MWQICLNYHQRMGIKICLNYHQRMGIKKCVNRDKSSFATKQRMFGDFAIDEILRYRWTRFISSRTLCHPGPDHEHMWKFRSSFSLKFDSLTLKIHFISCPLATDQAEGPYDGIRDSSSWLKIALFCKIPFRTHIIIIQGQKKYTQFFLTICCCFVTKLSV